MLKILTFFYPIWILNIINYILLIDVFYIASDFVFYKEETQRDQYVEHDYYDYSYYDSDYYENSYNYNYYDYYNYYNYRGFDYYNRTESTQTETRTFPTTRIAAKPGKKGRLAERKKKKKLAVYEASSWNYLQLAIELCYIGKVLDYVIHLLRYPHISIFYIYKTVFGFFNGNCFFLYGRI